MKNWKEYMKIMTSTTTKTIQNIHLPRFSDGEQLSAATQVRRLFP